MSILYDDKKKIFVLQSVSSTYMIGLADVCGYVGHIYYGKKLNGNFDNYFLRTEEPPFVPSVNNREKLTFLDTFPMEYSAYGKGDYREACLTVRTEQGYRGCEFFYKKHDIYKGKPELEGLPASFGEECETLDLYCEDAVLGLEIILRYSVFSDENVIARSVVVRNCSEKILYLERAFSACLDMDYEDYDMLTLHGSWARERHMERRKLMHGRQGTGSLRGETSHQEHPFLALMTPETTQDVGEVYAMNFVYSGNFLAQAEVTQHDTVRLVMGIHPEGFAWKLNPQDTFITPEVIMVYSDHGLGGMTKTFHDFFRKHLIRSSYLHRSRPILINNWEATYFDFDSDKLLEIAREAGKNGIEMLVMDDGWFGKRDSDENSLGDWTVNEEKIKQGLPKLVEAVGKMGMKFGIWFEPEMISPDSELFRSHPEWAIQIPGRDMTQSRQQYVLDLANQEVVDYIYEKISSIIRNAKVDYVKWDMNRCLTDLGSCCLTAECQGELFHRYVLGVYQMQERLIRDFPELLLENCSGGGGRFDAGMLYYSPQIWCSDDTDAIERLSIQEGTALVYPLSTMGAHVSDCPNHITGREIPFDTRGNVALAGSFGYELDITRIPVKDREMVQGQVDLYHKYSMLIREGDYDRIASYRENHLFDCWQVTAKDKSEAMVTYVQVLAQPNYRSRKMKLKNLLPEAEYYLEGSEKSYSGEFLMYGGFLVPAMKGDFQSKIYHFIKK